MGNDLQTSPAANLPANATPTVFTQTGDKNTQVAYANNVNNVINIIVSGALRSTGGTVNASLPLSTEYYNLFVIGNETFNDGCFLIEKDRALTVAEGIAPEISKRYAGLSEDAILQIKTFPALFASENHQYGRTDSNHQAFFGLVTDIRIQENGIKIYFQKLSPVPQQRLNEIAFNLAIKGSSSFNELNRTHWAIKRINLIEELRAAGISVLAPT